MTKKKEASYTSDYLLLTIQLCIKSVPISWSLKSNLTHHYNIDMDNNRLLGTAQRNLDPGDCSLVTVTTVLCGSKTSLRILQALRRALWFGECKGGYR